MIKDKIVTFRVTPKEYKQIKSMAGLFADGDISAWVRHCLDKYQPKMVTSYKKVKKTPKPSVNA